jgi:hypothetical protein
MTGLVNGSVLVWVYMPSHNLDENTSARSSSLFAADFILSHVLLFLLLPALCIPYVDRWHSVILFWLRPSRQIRPPIFSMKQNRLRKRIVRRYATLYFLIFIIFVALIVGPLVAGMSPTCKLFLTIRKQSPNEPRRCASYKLGSHPTQQRQPQSDYASQSQRIRSKFHVLKNDLIYISVWDGVYMRALDTVGVALRNMGEGNFCCFELYSSNHLFL